MSGECREFTRRRMLVSTAATVAVSSIGRNFLSPAHAAAGFLGAAAPTHYRFKIGEFEITTILDAGAVIDGPWPIVGEDRPAAEVESLMRDNMLPEKKFQPGFTPTLVNTGSQLILFDTGNGADGFIPRPLGGRLAKLLGSAGFSPEQVDLVVLTHGHPDHTGGLIENGQPLFPNARYVMGDVEYDFWASKDRLSVPQESNEYKWAKHFRANVVPLANRMTFVRPGGEVALGIHALEAFGHTPGHLAFHIGNRNGQLLLWGDCAHHEVASLARPDWHAFFDMAKDKGAATRKRIYDLAATDRLVVVGYHMTFPSVGFVEKKDAGYHWLPVSYQLNI
jgi:glyoxylase-like metal-dependent hydrolase (beta-lactamase superfamily II)